MSAGPTALSRRPDVRTSGWRRLSPRMLAVHPTLELLRALPALAGILFLGRYDGQGPLWTVAALVVVVGLGALRWVTTTYRVGPDQVQIRRGLLRRTVVSARRDRVRSVDLTSHWMHRLLGLAAVTIGTGTSDRRGDNGLRLDALGLAEAGRLRDELLHNRSTVAEPTAAPARGALTAAGPTAAALTVAAPTRVVPHPNAPAEPVLLAQLAPGWLRYGPFTLSGIVTAGIVAAFLSQFFAAAKVDPGRAGPLRAAVAQLHQVPLALALLEVLVVGALIVGAFSTIGYALAFWGFRLTRRGDQTLHVSRGLLTTRSTTIDLGRLRGIEVSEPLLLRSVGGARCIAITTGLHVGRGAERGGSLLLPPAPSDVAERVAGDVLGRPEPAVSLLQAHGPVARRRRHIRAAFGVVTAIAVVVVAGRLAVWPAATWQLSLLLVPIGLLVAEDRYRSLGHAVIGQDVVLRQGSFIRRRCVLAADGVIGWNMRQSLFQRRAGVVTLTATTAAGRQRYRLPDVDLARAVGLVNAGLPGIVDQFRRPPESTEE